MRKNNQRDSRGWHIPRVETKLARVWEMMVVGLPVKMIHLAIGGKPNAVRVMMNKIRHPEVNNARNNARWHRRKEKVNETR